MTPRIDPDDPRISILNNAPVRKRGHVLYWMQQSQRAEYNHALEYAIRSANRLKKPLQVVFGLTADYPEANLRHFLFMLQGLRETETALAERGIPMILGTGTPPAVALAAGRRAALIVCDMGYLRHQRAWRRQVAAKAACQVVQVESDVVVPVRSTSPKAEYAARTLRPKIRRKLDDALRRFRHGRIRIDSLGLKSEGIDLGAPLRLLERLGVDRRVPPVDRFFRGGTSQAKNRFRRFLREALSAYPENSNQPQTEDISQMSPYLHFGQISPLYLALRANAARPEAAVSAYLEQLIVRRELAVNFVYYTDGYDRFGSLPQWARRTLDDHRKDRRDPLYNRKRLEAAATHDPYWNAAMNEMKHTGFMHNYMRMYWGKKILEWSPTPETAFRTTLALNNKYFLDGRDPNSFAGVAWIFGLHDRAWQERPVFGKVRYMAASGLERKCDIGGYVERVKRLLQV